MGLAEKLQGAPEPDPKFILPPEQEEVYDEQALIEADRQSGRVLKIAVGGAAGLALFGSGILVAMTMNDQSPRASAVIEPSLSPRPENSLSPSASVTPSVSPSASPSFSAAPKAQPKPTRSVRPTSQSPSSPSHIPRPSATKSHEVVLSPSPRPEASEPVSEAHCRPNENAPGEVLCDQPVNAYKTPTGTELQFEITGGAAPHCDNIQAGRVEVAIGNAVGWASKRELGDPC